VGAAVAGLYNAQASLSSNDIQQQLTITDNFGAPSSLLATATYPNWVDLDINVDGSPLPHLTNSQCSNFRSLVTSTQLKARLIDELSRVLPVSSFGIVMPTSAVNCNPAFSLATYPDQQAVFNINKLKLTSVFTLFSDESYVVYNNGSILNHTLQPPEATAPLSVFAVRQAVQAALGRIFFDTFQNFTGL
jgi:hypothetical protein